MKSEFSVLLNFKTLVQHKIKSQKLLRKFLIVSRLWRVLSWRGGGGRVTGSTFVGKGVVKKTDFRKNSI